MATTIAWRRASPRWRARTCWCCSPTGRYLPRASADRHEREAHSAGRAHHAEIESMAGASGSELSRGGMTTKIEAGKIAATGGIHMVIASGRIDHPLRAIATATLHLVPDARQSGDGAQEMDRGLARTEGHPDDRCRRGRGAAPWQQSAPGGHHQGRWRVRARRRGDRARPGRHEIGRGLVAYDAEDAEKIRGKSSGDVSLILGIGGRAEMVHRDDLVLGHA